VLPLLLQQEAQRLPWLVPVRHSRMAQSPFAFFRGAAAVMAADLARQPHSGLMVQLCGDAHLLNFGFYASPERSLLFDLNDFDETYPGPFEWDVQRLAASLVLAARSLGLSSSQQEKICRRSLRAYAKAMAEFAAMPLMEMWVARLDLERLLAESHDGCLQNHLRVVIAAARRRNSRQGVRKLCESDGAGGLRFRHAPPLIWRFDQLDQHWVSPMNWQSWAHQSYDSYIESIRPEIRHLLSGFRFGDAAYKAVGVGSVGTRCAIGLFVGDDPDEVLLLQSKQAENSVLAPYLNSAAPAHQGERVVQGQRLMQTASDAFLGWTTSPSGDHFYWRTLRDWKGSVDVSCLDATALKDYGKLCAWTLAKAHARSGNRRAIADYLDKGKAFAATVLEQAITHADQAEHDHRQLLSAIAAGSLEASDVF
jgi:uncharacterized protein (DUF2252 family)